MLLVYKEGRFIMLPLQKGFLFIMFLTWKTNFSLEQEYDDAEDCLNEAHHKAACPARHVLL